MQDIVKVENRIKSQIPNSTGGVDYILENGTWLGDSFNFLPKGIINKKITGIGATTLELEAKRHSIIIEPLKCTVSQKTIGKKQYFGYSVDNNRVTNELKNYLANNKYEYKKIVIVIDNLERLINDIGDLILDYFLLFDEIDFMQGSSSYRQKMELGIDIGKVHGDFALVSATVINFSDPDLLFLKRTTFSYEAEEKIPLRLFNNSSATYDHARKKRYAINELNSYITYQLKNNSDKILIALNSVKLIELIANSLVSKQIIESNEITLLISDNKYSNLELKVKFSNKGIENEKLPTRLNFITSAYFNGYDLYDNYRLAIFTSPPVGSTMLTINEIKQIYGRNRIKEGVIEFVLFSHDCLIEDVKNEEFLNYTTKDWLEYAESQVELLKCVDKHFKKNNNKENKKKAIEIFHAKLQENLEKNQFVLSRKKTNISITNFSESILNNYFAEKINTVAYYQIDYLLYLHDQLKNIYLNSPAFFVFEKNSFNSTTPRFEQILTENSFLLDSDFSKKEWSIEKTENITRTQKEEIAKIVSFIIQNKDIDKQKLDVKQFLVYNIIELATKTYSQKSTVNQILLLDSFDKLTQLKDYLILKSESENHILVRQIKYYFKPNTKITSQEIQSKVKTIYGEIGRSIQNITSIKEAITFLSLVYDVNKANFRLKNGGNKVSGYMLKKGKKYPALRRKK